MLRADSKNLNVRFATTAHRNCQKYAVPKVGFLSKSGRFCWPMAP